MADLLLQADFKAKTERYLVKPSHALLVTGPAGAGKGAVLDHLANELVGNSVAKILRVEPEPDKKDIGIDAVRRIQHFVSLKSTDKSLGIHRVVLIEDAQLLTNEAQNALLKIIEEPPEDTVLLLSSVTSRQLLPTINSRVQEMPLTLPDKTDLRNYLFRTYKDENEVDRALQMSSGLPGFAISLLEQSNDHPMYQAAEQARKLLAASKFERTLLIDSLNKQREQAIDTCDMLGRMAHIMLKSPKLNQSQQQQWLNVLKYSTEASDNLRAYGNPKLTLTSLSLHL